MTNRCDALSLSLVSRNIVACVALLCLQWSGDSAATTRGDVIWVSTESTNNTIVPDLHLIRAMSKFTSPLGIVWSGDSKRIAAFSYSGNNITIWDDNGKELNELHHTGA